MDFFQKINFKEFVLKLFFISFVSLLVIFFIMGHAEKRSEFLFASDTLIPVKTAQSLIYGEGITGIALKITNFFIIERLIGTICLALSGFHIMVSMFINVFVNTLLLFLVVNYIFKSLKKTVFTILIILAICFMTVNSYMPLIYFFFDDFHYITILACIFIPAYLIRNNFNTKWKFFCPILILLSINDFLFLFFCLAPLIICAFIQKKLIVAGKLFLSFCVSIIIFALYIYYIEYNFLSRFSVLIRNEIGYKKVIVFATLGIILFCLSVFIFKKFRIKVFYVYVFYFSGLSIGFSIGTKTSRYLFPFIFFLLVFSIKELYEKFNIKILKISSMLVFFALGGFFYISNFNISKAFSIQPNDMPYCYINTINHIKGAKNATGYIWGQLEALDVYMHNKAQRVLNFQKLDDRKIPFYTENSNSYKNKIFNILVSPVGIEPQNKDYKSVYKCEYYNIYYYGANYNLLPNNILKNMK